MYRLRFLFLLGSILALLAAGCSPQPPIRYKTPVPTAQIAPTASPTPVRLFPSPTPGSKLTATPTPLLRPTAAATRVPVPTPVDTTVVKALSATGLTLGTPGQIEGGIKLETLDPASQEGRRFSIHVGSTEFNGLRDDILYMGYNVRSIGAGEREDESLHSLRLALEANYREPGGGEFSELNLDFIRPSGDLVRPLAFAIATDGSASSWLFRGRLFAVEDHFGLSRLFAVNWDNRTVQLYPANFVATAEAQSPSMALKLVGAAWNSTSQASVLKTTTLQTVSGAGPAEKLPYRLAVKDNEDREIASFDGVSKGLRVSGGVMVGTESSPRPLGSLFRKSLDPESRLYQAGHTTLVAYDPAQGFIAIQPVTWALPPKRIDVEACIVLVWSGDFSTERCNPSSATILTEKFDEILLSLPPATDGQWITKILFTTKNNGGAAVSADLNAFDLAGWQY